MQTTTTTNFASPATSASVRKAPSVTVDLGPLGKQWSATAWYHDDEVWIRLKGNWLNLLFPTPPVNKATRSDRAERLLKRTYPGQNVVAHLGPAVTGAMRAYACVKWSAVLPMIRHGIGANHLRMSEEKLAQLAPVPTMAKNVRKHMVLAAVPVQPVPATEADANCSLLERLAPHMKAVATIVNSASARELRQLLQDGVAGQLLLIKTILDLL